MKMVMYSSRRLFFSAFSAAVSFRLGLAIPTNHSGPYSSRGGDPEYSKRSSLRRSEMFIDTHFDDVPSPFGGAERILEDTTLVDFRSSERS